VRFRSRGVQDATENSVDNGGQREALIIVSEHLGSRRERIGRNGQACSPNPDSAMPQLWRAAVDPHAAPQAERGFRCWMFQLQGRIPSPAGYEPQQADQPRN
jgi:hypothetical protein